MHGWSINFRGAVMPQVIVFAADFMPHGHCYFWQPAIIALHVSSDSLIALAYFSIPLMLVRFVRARPDLPF